MSIRLSDLAALMPWSLPAGTSALFLDFRAHMHGMVMLEVLGQLHLPTEQADALVASMVARMSDELEAAARGEPDRVDPEQEPISAAEGR